MDYVSGSRIAELEMHLLAAKVKCEVSPYGSRHFFQLVEGGGTFACNSGSDAFRFYWWELQLRLSVKGLASLPILFYWFQALKKLPTDVS